MSKSKLSVQHISVMLCIETMLKGLCAKFREYELSAHSSQHGGGYVGGQQLTVLTAKTALTTDNSVNGANQERNTVCKHHQLPAVVEPMANS